MSKENRSLLPGAKKLLPRDALATLGEEMEQLICEFLESEPRLEIPGETDEAAPLT